MGDLTSSWRTAPLDIVVAHEGPPQCHLSRLPPTGTSMACLTWIWSAVRGISRALCVGLRADPSTDASESSFDRIHTSPQLVGAIVAAGRYWRLGGAHRGPCECRECHPGTLTRNFLGWPDLAMALSFLYLAFTRILQL